MSEAEAPPPSDAEIITAEFDVEHYLGRLGARIDDPVGHYLARGWELGLDPSPGFDTRFYLRAYPDVAAAGVNPFLHYLAEGRAQGRPPTWSAMAARAAEGDGVLDLLALNFDRDFYLDRIPSLRGADVDPVAHYLTYGWRLGLDPAPGFSGAFYLSRSPDVTAAGMNPFHHYLGWGRREGRASHPDALTQDKVFDGEVEAVMAAAFDRDFYMRSHPELAETHVDPVKHYLHFGAGQGFDPTPAFSTRWYLERSPDVAAAGMNPFHHYLVWGRVEGRSPSPDAPADLFGPESTTEVTIAREFDADFYVRDNPAAAATHVVPVKHYLHYGWRGGADPSADFSTRFYLRQDPALADAGENPLHHYIRVGRARGRLPRSPVEAPDADYPVPDGAFLESELVADTLRPEFDAAFYASAYPDAVAGGVDPVWDYMLEGWRAGRDPTPWFATGDYLARFPDVEAGRYNPFFHYLVWGRAQGLAPFVDPARGVPVRRVGSSRTVWAPDLRETVPTSARPAAQPLRLPPLPEGRLDLHWVVPDIDGPGRGGHMTILRIVRGLELMGHRCTLWVLDPDYARSTRERVDLVLRDYQVVRAQVRLLSDAVAFPPSAVLVATSWATAHRVRAIPGGAAKAYFVQDDEAAFHAAGARALAAEATYDFDMAFLCAGPWLQRKLERRGRWVRAFALAADERYAAPPDARPENATPRIAFYARDHTPRRAVELGLLAFEILAARGVDFHVDLFGAVLDLPEAPFSAAMHGVVEIEALQALYAACDLGVCLSATNYSLVPQEMMVCGLPVVELDVESTRAVFPDGTAALAGPSPEDLADAIARLLADAPARAAQAERAARWVAGFSWEASAQAVEAALLERLGAAPVAAPAVVGGPPCASVIIPTYNGGERFKAVLARVLAQRTPDPFEVIVVDSRSDDGTWEHLEAQGARVRRLRIDKAEFQHGRTRNLAAGMAEGEHLAFLTQDALPADAFWLYDLMTTLDRFPLAAGAFGRHRARPEASPFVRRGIEDHFRAMGRGGLEASKHQDLDRWRSRDEGFRRFLHFFSSNNACIRRSVWSRHPLPEIDYGEDQAWAAEVIDEGYSRVYAPLATVIHSHDYGEAEMFERTRIDTRFQMRTFGYRVAPADPERRIREMDAADQVWAARRGVTAELVAQKMRLNAAEVAGMMAGAADATS